MTRNIWESVQMSSLNSHLGCFPRSPVGKESNIKQVGIAKNVQKEKTTYMLC